MPSFANILTRKVTELATETILDFLMKNNAAVKNGGSLYIGPTRWCKGAGTGGADRMAVYVKVGGEGPIHVRQNFVRGLLRPLGGACCAGGHGGLCGLGIIEQAGSAILVNARIDVLIHVLVVGLADARTAWRSTSTIPGS